MANLGLDLERRDGGGETELDEGERERGEGEDDEEEDNVVAVEEVVGHPGRVAEPYGLGEGQAPPQRLFRLHKCRIRKHFRRCSKRPTASKDPGADEGTPPNSRKSYRLRWSASGATVTAAEEVQKERGGGSVKDRE